MTPELEAKITAISRNMSARYSDDSIRDYSTAYMLIRDMQYALFTEEGMSAGWKYLVHAMDKLTAHIAKL